MGIAVAVLESVDGKRADITLGRAPREDLFLRILLQMLTTPNAHFDRVASPWVGRRFVDPKAEYWDPKAQQMLVGPLSTKVFYQFAGIRDLSLLTRP